MNKTIILIAFIAVASHFAASAQAVYLSENFNGGLPAGWTLINNDGLTPDINVSFVNDAWVAAPDPDSTSTGDSVMVSTSWYAPSGISDDYLITPSLTIGANTEVAWDAKAYDPLFRDGYELRISTTTPTTAGFLANPPLYSISSAATTWARLKVNLASAGYANQAVFLAWRNNSNDKFLLAVDNIVVQDPVNFDVGLGQVSLPNPEYTVIPLHQEPVFVLSGYIQNLGADTVNNARLVINILRDGVLVHTDSSAGAQLIAANSLNAIVSPYTPIDTGVYIISYRAVIDEQDQVPSNNVDSTIIVVTRGVFARDNGIVTNSLSIGANTTGELGQNFTLAQPAILESVSIFLVNINNAMVGQPVSLNVYPFNVTPGALIGNTDTVVVTQPGSQLVELPMHGGPMTLPPGTYSFLAVEGDSALTIGTATQIFTPQSTWASIDGGPSGHNENFNFNVTYVLRPFLSADCSNLTATVNSVTDNVCPGETAGAINISVSGQVGRYSILWTTGDSTEDISGLTSGTYSATITDAVGCTYTLPDQTVGVTDSLPNGSISASAAGATVNFASNSTNGDNFSWNFGDGNTSTVANPAHTYAANGTYIVSLAITNSCGSNTLVDTLTLQTVSLEDQRLANHIILSPNPNRGTFTIQFDQVSLSNVRVAVFSMSGQRIYQATLGDVRGAYHHQVNLEREYPAGIYLLDIQSGDTRITKRIQLE